MKITKNLTADNKYELVITNESNESFHIHYGGADLYWSMLDYEENNIFDVTPEVGAFYDELSSLFKLIQESDNPQARLLKGNCFEWLSEAYGLPEEAHKLLITKKDDVFHIEFIRNPANFSPVYTCFISFCLSGSRNQKIANAFSLMFLRCQGYDFGEDNLKR